jgi:endoglucanase
MGPGLSRTLAWRELIPVILTMQDPRVFALLLPVLLCAPGSQAQRIDHGEPGLTEAIRLNQLGFYPRAPKAVVIAGSLGDRFHVVTTDRRDTMFTGRLGRPAAAAFAAETVRIADFSAVRVPGRYVIAVSGLGSSHAFEIGSRVHEELVRAALKAFYFQRASTALELRYAGPWSRPAGHADTLVLVHASAATAERPAGTIISSPGGWYDAGDYNKYIVNSGITVATLLSLYEDFPEYVRSFDVAIPESGDALPDLLQEALWNVRWMLTMQDPSDGGVYHKLTEPRFEGFVMPREATSPRYVVQKTTAATLDFAAVMAQASRVLRSFQQTLPSLADSAITAALRAWQWARRNPGVWYDQGGLNQQFEPDIETGTYGDRDVGDEFVWAATELGVTTAQDSFFAAVPLFPDGNAPLPSWQQVRTLAYYTFARFRDMPPRHVAGSRGRVERLLLRQADRLVRQARRSADGTAMGGGGAADDFVWGSNAVAANQGIALVVAYRLTGERAYLRHALGNLDYLLGRNATGYSFVTGFGDRTPRHPHHRPSAADGIDAPVPGLLVGGPNPGRQDGCVYPSVAPDRAYVDDVCSYASNEVAINWNAPLVYLTAALEALQYDAGWSSRVNGN